MTPILLLLPITAMMLLFERGFGTGISVHVLSLWS